MQNPDRDFTREVAALEADIRHHVIDLEVAFSTRDWALVARIYRAVATLADRLEAIDPDARSRTLERIELEQQAREEAFAGDDDPLLDELAIDVGDDPLLDTLAMAGDDDPLPGQRLGDGDAGEVPGGGARAGELEPNDSPDGHDPFSPWRLR
jgi:hypothetical protein